MDYATWNRYAGILGLPEIDPAIINLVVFETNRGTQDNQNPLWNDKWTLGEEGSPYEIRDENGDAITQLENVYELDRAHWSQPVPVSAPAAILLFVLD